VDEEIVEPTDTRLALVTRAIIDEAIIDRDTDLLTALLDLPRRLAVQHPACACPATGLLSPSPDLTYRP
jgi:hypothetical protein